jgi:hypothetical protein
VAVFQAKAFSSREGTTQTVAYDGSSVTATNPFGSETFQVRIVATSACCYAIDSAAVTAADNNTSEFLPALTDRIVTVTPGQYIAFIQKATNGLVTGTPGTAWITELS